MPPLGGRSAAGLGCLRYAFAGNQNPQFTADAAVAFLGHGRAGLDGARR